MGSIPHLRIRNADAQWQVVVEKPGEIAFHVPDCPLNIGNRLESGGNMQASKWARIELRRRIHFIPWTPIFERRAAGLEDSSPAGTGSLCIEADRFNASRNGLDRVKRTRIRSTHLLHLPALRTMNIQPGPLQVFPR
jgi:hypothetical protein